MENKDFSGQADASPGCVPTPRDLARRLVRRLAGPDGPPRAVLDPACGEGALLLAALEARGNSPSFARSGLFGIERDPVLAERCRARLRAAAGLTAGTELDAHVLCADALDPELSWPADTCVAANPPWVSFSGRGSAGLEPAARRALVARFAGCERWPSLHAAFAERIARHVAAEGSRAALLLPASVGALEGYGPLRRAITELTEPDGQPELLAEDAFPGVLEPALLVGLRPAGSSASASARAWVTRSVDDADLLDHLSAFPRLPAGTFADPGVHSGNCSAELVRRDGPATGPALREGRCLRPYDLGPARAWLDLSLRKGRDGRDPSRPARRFRVGPEEHYAGFPVLLRQTADRPIAALHAAPTYFRNSLLAAREVEGLDPAFVVAVLNGPVAAAWHRLSFLDARQRSFPQVKVGHLSTQPFPIARRADDPALHDGVAAAARALARAGERLGEARAIIDERVLEAFGLPGALRERVEAVAGAGGRRPRPSLAPARPG